MFAYYILKLFSPRKVLGIFHSFSIVNNMPINSRVKVLYYFTLNFFLSINSLIYMSKFILQHFGELLLDFFRKVVQIHRTISNTKPYVKL